MASPLPPCFKNQKLSRPPPSAIRNPIVLHSSLSNKRKIARESYAYKITCTYLKYQKQWKGLFGHKVESKLVIVREQLEALTNSACSFIHSQKGKNMLDPPSSHCKKNNLKLTDSPPPSPFLGGWHHICERPLTKVFIEQPMALPRVAK